MSWSPDDVAQLHGLTHNAALTMNGVIVTVRGVDPDRPGRLQVRMQGHEKDFSVKPSNLKRPATAEPDCTPAAKRVSWARPLDDAESATPQRRSVGELKSLIQQAGLSDAGIVERSELELRAEEAQQKLAASGAEGDALPSMTPPTPPTPPAPPPQPQQPAQPAWMQAAVVPMMPPGATTEVHMAGGPWRVTRVRNLPSFYADSIFTCQCMAWLYMSDAAAKRAHCEHHGGDVDKGTKNATHEYARRPIPCPAIADNPPPRLPSPPPHGRLQCLPMCARSICLQGMAAFVQAYTSADFRLGDRSGVRPRAPELPARAS